MPVTRLHCEHPASPESITSGLGAAELRLESLPNGAPIREHVAKNRLCPKIAASKFDDGVEDFAMKTEVVRGDPFIASTTGQE